MIEFINELVYHLQLLVILQIMDQNNKVFSIISNKNIQKHIMEGKVILMFQKKLQVELINIIKMQTNKFIQN